ncbi:MAG: hypothetical protein JWM80_822, partial [Cyanobacteria bacterium RYN_339]|nr:hypothetical protein [Cyanobacteria bacterium RYN_339]
MQYQLQPGDSLQALARANRTTVTRLLQDNPQLQANGMHIGDSIHISVGSAQPEFPGLVEYPVQPGDTLASIAGHLMHDPRGAAELRALNQDVMAELNHGFHLEVGDRLLVPVAAQQPQPVPQPAIPQPQPAAVTPVALDNLGVTAQGPQVVAEQQAANAWLNSPAGQAWASGPGLAATGGAGQMLVVDGLEGPHTRAVLKAMQAAQGANPTTAAVGPAQSGANDVVSLEQQAGNAWLATAAGQKWAHGKAGQAALAATGGRLPVNGQLDEATLTVMKAMIHAES